MIQYVAQLTIAIFWMTTQVFNRNSESFTQQTSPKFYTHNSYHKESILAIVQILMCYLFGLWSASTTLKHRSAAL
jgi:desulfoferrodoxin (superoxide reductase-like protein)